ncbi:hypothetical protein M407DRAFT_242986 [Tulasnella calospora MUT 4182]|uniref:Uncharacterized protein n=1 Tax=Tulasnella calospora MUT 4182 TaxID=1051891 RepID=A0A0C3M4H4_9AGAM|nr:hypothetical protein M407DRAFT_244662 [Tulasnella calospora MUT 4182]KIO28582.1 hypothetical protein M407DRAFT_242986 [Tulasnella calospora MUT 4182]
MAGEAPIVSSTTSLGARLSSHSTDGSPDWQDMNIALERLWFTKVHGKRTKSGL